MSARIEIDAIDVKEAQKEMMRLLDGSDVLKKAIEDSYRWGKHTEKWAAQDAEWRTHDLANLASYLRSASIECDDKKEHSMAQALYSFSKFVDALATQPQDQER